MFEPQTEADRHLRTWFDARKFMEDGEFTTGIAMARSCVEHVDDARWICSLFPTNDDVDMMEVIRSHMGEHYDHRANTFLALCGYEGEKMHLIIAAARAGYAYAQASCPMMYVSDECIDNACLHSEPSALYTRARRGNVYVKEDLIRSSQLGYPPAIQFCAQNYMLPTDPNRYIVQIQKIPHYFTGHLYEARRDVLSCIACYFTNGMWVYKTAVYHIGHTLHYHPSFIPRFGTDQLRYADAIEFYITRTMFVRNVIHAWSTCGLRIPGLYKDLRILIAKKVWETRAE